MNPLVRIGRSSLRKLSKRHPRAKHLLGNIETRLGLAEHSLAQVVPAIIQARPRKLTIAITAHCNLRCVGCRYERDFMLGQQLSFSMVQTALSDAKLAGIETVRLYGGEPLLHPQLPDMVRHATSLGLSTYVTTNGILLRQKIDDLYAAGLRSITIGFYGTLGDYDKYVQREKSFRRLESGIASIRDRYGSAVSLQLNFLLMRPSCDRKALYAALAFAEKYDLTLSVDLIHYSLPYFTDGANQELQFREEDRPLIVDWVAALADIKAKHPQRIKESLLSIYSIPDWLVKKPNMRVPCDAHKLIWIGADGTVQLCYAAFSLGNLHERRLRDILFTDAHRRAAQGAFALNCPNCHCERESRILKHAQSREYYNRIISNS
jgi:MoaA/NifB/PqqE/SkfB family radical SAM enzyme